MPPYTSVWLDYLIAKDIKLDVKAVQVNLVMGDQHSGNYSLCIFMCIRIFACHFFAAMMHVSWLRTSQLHCTPISLT